MISFQDYNTRKQARFIVSGCLITLLIINMMTPDYASQEEITTQIKSVCTMALLGASKNFMAGEDHACCAPVTTGEMLKGRSSMLMTKVLPQNSVRVS